MKLTPKAACFLIIYWSATYTSSCRKENAVASDQSNLLRPKQPPVANAGADVVVNLISCYSDRSAELNGSQSFDPDDYKKSGDTPPIVTYFINYTWSKISGPSCTLSDSTLSKAHVSNLTVGQYNFELKVTDPGGLSSRDTVVVSVTGSPSPSEYNLDITVNGRFVFTDNYEDCDYYDFLGYQCFFYDYTNIGGSFDLSSLGQADLAVYEYSDTATNSNDHTTYMELRANNGAFVSGYCSINFKKLIQQGAVSFDGTYKIEYGSARNCDPKVFASLDPLIVTGRLDTATLTTLLNIKGRVFF